MMRNGSTLIYRVSLCTLIHLTLTQFLLIMGLTRRKSGACQRTCTTSRLSRTLTIYLCLTLCSRVMLPSGVPSFLSLISTSQKKWQSSTDIGSTSLGLRLLSKNKLQEMAHHQQTLNLKHKQERSLHILLTATNMKKTSSWKMSM